MNKKLEKEIIEQLGYTIEDLEKREEGLISTLCDIANHGADCGYGGFTYSADLLDFYKTNKKLVLAELKEIASDFDTDMLNMIKNFNCLKDNNIQLDEIAEILYGNYKHDYSNSVIDAVGWCLLEHLAQGYAN